MNMTVMSGTILTRWSSALCLVPDMFQPQGPTERMALESNLPKTQMQIDLQDGPLKLFKEIEYS